VGKIEKLACAMPECLCRHPKGREYFVRRPDPPSDWAPSADHIHLKSEGGQLDLENVRLAHVLCNRVDYARNHGIRHDKDLVRAASAQFEDTVTDSSDVYRCFLEHLGMLFKENSLNARIGVLSSSNEEFERGRVNAYSEVIALMKAQAGAVRS
jgi:hypothetical protein